MLDFVTKSEYFSWLDQRIADRNNHTLKGIQDAWIQSILWNKESLKMGEIGGGQSRVLERLSKANECWNIDKFEGYGAGPTDIPQIPGVKVVRSYLGEFNPEIPDEYFDVVFSISVVEHIPKQNLKDFFADCYRILKPGGVMLQAIDLYIFDDPADEVQTINAYREAVESQGFIWLDAPSIDGNATFKCRYATNSDNTLNVWNRIAPALKPIREVAQSVTIKLAAFKPPADGTEVNRNFFVVPEISPTEPYTSSRFVEEGRRPDQIVLGSQTSQSSSKPQPEEKPLSKSVEAPSQPSSSVAVKPEKLQPTPDEKTASRSSNNPRKKKNRKKNKSSAKAMPSATSTNTVSESSGSSVGRVTSVVGRIVKYYSRWPVAVGAIAIGLNTTAFLLDEPFQWIFIASGTTLLLFLVGHAASKADYVLDEVIKVQNKTHH